MGLDMQRNSEKFVKMEWKDEFILGKIFFEIHT